jgi:hypothetical protein
MFFLLRVAFWLTLVLALLPSGSSQPSAQASQVGAADAVVAAGAAVSDMSNFCDRQPGACAVGAQAAVAIGQRAQAGAKMVYEFINDRIATTETGSVSERRESASRPGASGVPLPVTNLTSQSTLKPSDLEPGWRGPLPLRHPVPLPRPRPDHRHSA